VIEILSSKNLFGKFSITCLIGVDWRKWRTRIGHSNGLEIPNLSRHDYKEKISWKDFGKRNGNPKERDSRFMSLRSQRKKISTRDRE